MYDNKQKEDTKNGMKYDIGKPRYSLIPPAMIDAVARVLTYGAEKYEANNWQKLDNAEERYTDALLRHLYRHLDGEILDPESGLPHIDMVATNAGFIIHLRKVKNGSLQ